MSGGLGGHIHLYQFIFIFWFNEMYTPIFHAFKHQVYYQTIITEVFIPDSCLHERFPESITRKRL